MNWKIIGLSALINAALTIVLSSIFLPLLFLGPLTGGFFSSYLSKGYEDYDKMDEKDGAVVGAVSGLIGGLIIALLLLLGFGAINTIIGIFTNIGAIASSNTLIMEYIILQITLIMSFVLGIIGGVIGVIVKE